MDKRIHLNKESKKNSYKKIEEERLSAIDKQLQKQYHKEYNTIRDKFLTDTKIKRKNNEDIPESKVREHIRDIFAKGDIANYVGEDFDGEVLDKSAYINGYADITDAINSMNLAKFVQQEKNNVYMSKGDVFKGSKVLSPESKTTKRSLGDVSGLKDFFTSFNDVVSGKINTGTRLIQKAVHLDANNRGKYLGAQLSTGVDNLLRSVQAFKAADNFLVYDLETFGGDDKFGTGTASFITEFSAKVMDKQGNVKNNYTTAIGFFDNTQKAELQKMIKDVKKASKFATNEELVTMTRLAKYSEMKFKGYSGTGLEALKFEELIKTGLAEVESLADTDSMSFETLMEKAEEGFKIFNELGNIQKAQANGGPLAWQTLMVDAFDNHNKGKMPLLHFNGVNADSPWMRVLEKSGFPNPLVVDPNNSLDLLNAKKLHDRKSKNGALGFYDDKDILQSKVPKLTGKGISQQESLVNYLGNTDQAHVGGEDTYQLGLHAPAIVDKFDEVFRAEKLYEGINNNNIDIRNKLLYANTSKWGNTAPMAFIKDSVTGTYKTLDGFEFGESAEVGSVMGGVKKGGVYNVIGINTISLTDEGTAEVAKAYRDLGQRELYSVTMKPVSILNHNNQHIPAVNKLNDEITYFFKNQEQLFGFLDTHDTIGIKKDGDFSNTHSFSNADSFNEVWESVLDPEEFDPVNVLTNKKGDEGRYVHKLRQNKKATLENLVFSSTHMLTNDSAARMIRENDYEKMGKFYKFEDALIEAGVDPENIEGILKNFYKNKDKKVPNTDKTLMTTMEDIMGFKKGEGKKLYTNTIDKYIAARKTLADQRPLFDMITTKTTNAQQAALAFDRAIAELNHKGAIKLTKELYGTEDQDLVRMIMNTQGYDYRKNPAIMFNKKEVMDYYELDVAKIIEKRQNKNLPIVNEYFSNNDTKTIRINRNASPGSLIKQLDPLYGYNYGTKTNSDIQDLSTIKTFIADIKELYNEDDNPLIKAINKMDVGEAANAPKFSTQLLGSQIISAVNEIRDSDDPKIKYSGILNQTVRQNVLEGNRNIQQFTPEEMEAIVDNVIEELPTIHKAKDINIQVKNAAETAVKRNMPDREGFIKDLKAQNMAKEQQDYMVKLYDATFADSVYGYNKFLDGILKTNSDFIVDPTGSMLITRSGESRGIALDVMPRVEYQNGLLYAKIGNQKQIISSSISYKNGKAEFSSSLRRSYEMARNSSRALRKESTSKDIFNTINGMASGLRKSIAESASVTSSNIAEINKMMFVNVGDTIVQNFGELAKGQNNFFKNIGIYDNDFNKLFKGMLGELDKDPKKFADKYKGFENLLSGQKEFLAKNLLKITEGLANEYGDENFKSILSLLNTSLNETELGMGVLQFGSNLAHAMNSSNNQQRPVPTQSERTWYYSKENTEKRLDKFYGTSNERNNKYLKPLIATQNTIAMTERRFETMSDLAVNTINTPKFETSQIGMRKLVLGAYEKNKDNTNVLFNGMDINNISNPEKAAEKLKNELAGLSVMEDSGVVDARLADSMFVQNEIQKINVRKEIFTNMKNTDDLMKEMRDLGKNVLPHVEVDKNGNVKVTKNMGKLVGRNYENSQKLLETIGFGGDPERFFAKENYGVFKLDFFHSGTKMIASEDDIAKAINGFTFDFDGMTEVQKQAKVLSTLSETFDMAYSVHRASLQNYFKMEHAGSEKAMMYAPMFKIGDIDEKLREQLIAKSKTVGNTDVQHLLESNVLLSTSAIEDYLLPSLYSEKEAKKISERIYQERHAVSSFIFNKDVVGHNASMIVSQGNLKHGNLGNIMEGSIGILNERMNGNTEQLYKALTGGEYGKFINGAELEYKDGQIILPDNKLEGEVKYNLSVLGKINKSLGFGDDIISNALDGGHVVYTASAQVEDHQAGTASLYDPNLEKVRARLETETNLKDRAGLVTEYNKLSVRKNTIDKGMKISQRELDVLDLRGYNDSMLKTLEGEQGLLSYLTDENGKWKAELEGKSVLGGLTSNLREKILSGDSYVTYEDILNNDELSKEYKHLLDYYSVDADKNVLKTGLGKLDEAYSVSAGLQAIEFNSGEISKETLQDSRFNFKAINAKDVVSARQGEINQLREIGDNIYNDNLLIDFGEEFGESRFLALGKMPHRQSGDNPVPYNFQKDLKSLSHRYNDYQQSVFAENGIDRAEAKEEVLKNIERIKTSYIKDIGSKEGLVSEFLSTRLDYSTIGKASTMSYYGKEAKDLGAGENPEQLKKAKFLEIGEDGVGKYSSLEDLADRGKFIDAEWHSRQTFENAGYFNTDFIDNTFGDLEEYQNAISNATDEVAAKQQFMEDRLVTYGTSGLAGRPPAINEGSTMVNMKYLDRSLNENQKKVMHWTQKALIQDNDGDQHISSFTNIKNQRDNFMKYVATGVEVVKKDEFGNIVVDDDNNVVMELVSNREKTQAIMDTNAESIVSITHRAVGINRYYNESSQKDMKEQYEEGKAGINVNPLDSKALTKTGLYSDGYAYTEMSKLPDQTRLYEASDLTAQFEKEMGISISRDDKNYLSAIDEGLQTITDETQRTKYRDAIMDVQLFGRFENQSVAKARKYSIGEANIPLFKLRSLSLMSNMAEGNEYGNARMTIQQGAYGLEQEIISAKKGNVRDYVTSVSDFNDALRSLMSGEQDSRAKMEHWMSNNEEALTKRFASSGRQMAAENIGDYRKILDSSTDDKIVDKAMYEELKTQWLNQVENLMKDNSLSQVRDTLKLGVSQDGLDGKAIANMLNSGLEGNNKHLNNALLNNLTELGLVEQNYLSNDSIKKNANTYDDMVPDKDFITKSAGQALQNIVESSKGSFSSKNIALGAIGIAAGIMTAGYVGGDPTSAYQNDASDFADQGGNIPSFFEINEGMIPTHQKGYIININAKSEKDRKKVEQVISQAMSQSIPTDVNISMNINDLSGNISDRKIEEAIMGIF